MTWSTLPPSRKRMRPRSKTKRQWNAEGRARPDEPLAIDCEARLAGVCTGRAQERHHLIPRGPGSSDEAWNTRDICDADHDYIHAHGDWARACGWLRRPPRIKVIGAALAHVYPDPVDDCLCPGLHNQSVRVLPDGRVMCHGCDRPFDLVPCASGWGGGWLPEHPRKELNQ